jgi:hypothetical protein
MANLIRWRRDVGEGRRTDEQRNNVAQGNKLSRPLRLIVFAFQYDLLTQRHVSALRTSHSKSETVSKPVSGCIKNWFNRFPFGETIA